MDDKRIEDDADGGIAGLFIIPSYAIALHFGRMHRDIILRSGSCVLGLHDKCKMESCQCECHSSK